MIVALLNVYLVILFILVKMKIISFNLFWKCSPLLVLLLLMFGLFIPMDGAHPKVLRSWCAIRWRSSPMSPAK